MEFQASAKVAAHHILTQQLYLTKNNNLTVIFEEETRSVAYLFEEVAKTEGVSTTLICVPFTTQVDFGASKRLPDPLRAAVEQSDALINCINDASETTRFRTALVDLRTTDLSIGHVPGVSMSMLENYFDFDLEKIIERCKFLAYPLAVGTSVKIITEDRHGIQHTLRAKLGGWNRLPIVSDGTVPRGSWGNLLPGETFIAPIEGSADGTIVINGALEGLVIQHESELILQFSHGKLVSRTSENSEILDHFQMTTAHVAAASNDKNWVNLAEIGIGVNESITRLTGTPLIDEKMYGTVHIALGNNSPLGGSVSSSIHYDMTTHHPSVELKTLGRNRWRLLIDKGQLVGKREAWVSTLRNIYVPSHWASRVHYVKKNALRTEHSDNNIRIAVKNASAKTLHFEIGDARVSNLANQVLDYIGDREIFQIDWTTLAAELGQTSETLRKVVRFLELHQFLQTRTER